jgi:hypothetical protein
MEATCLGATIVFERTPLIPPDARPAAARKRAEKRMIEENFIEVCIGISLVEVI